MEYEELISNFEYNNNTGLLNRITRKNSNGSKDKFGYLIIKYKGKQHKAHRLIWLYNYKKYPDNLIDHINGITSDNRIENLRDVSCLENSLNHKRKANDITGYVGIYKDEITKGLKSKFTTQFNNKQYRFLTIEECINFRKNNNLKL
jgi:hypothetical protein